MNLGKKKLLLRLGACSHRLYLFKFVKSLMRAWLAFFSNIKTIVRHILVLSRVDRVQSHLADYGISLRIDHSSG